MSLSSTQKVLTCSLVGLLRKANQKVGRVKTPQAPSQPCGTAQELSPWMCECGSTREDREQPQLPVLRGVHWTGMVPLTAQGLKPDLSPLPLAPSRLAHLSSFWAHIRLMRAPSAPIWSEASLSEPEYERLGWLAEPPSLPPPFPMC